MGLIPSGGRFQILVGDGCPAFYQKTMRIIITSGYITQRPFGNQASGSDTGRTDYALGSVAPEFIGVFIDVHRHAIHMDGLVNISGNKPGIISVLLQVIINPFGTAIRQV